MNKNTLKVIGAIGILVLVTGGAFYLSNRDVIKEVKVDKGKVTVVEKKIGKKKQKINKNKKETLPKKETEATIETTEPKVTPQEKSTQVDEETVIEESVLPDTPSETQSSVEGSYVAPTQPNDVSDTSTPNSIEKPTAPPVAPVSPSVNDSSNEGFLTEVEAIELILKETGMDVSDKMFFVESADPHTFHIEVRQKNPNDPSITNFVGIWAVQRGEKVIYKLS